MNLPELSVRRPVFVTCIFFLILALGVLARTRLSTALYPDVSFPVLNVVIPFPGAGPDEVEAQVAEPIETALNSLPGIREVRSMSLESVGILTAAFTMDTDIHYAEQKVTQLVARMRGDLPKGIGEPSVRSVDPTETPVTSLSLRADLPEAELFDLADREVRPLLEQISQVGWVQVRGARKREIQVELDLAKLNAHEMSAEEVVGRLGAAGVNVPAGELEDPEHLTLVRTLGAFDSLDSIRRTPIRFVGNESATTLGEIADVKDGLEDERNRVYVNGVQGLSISVYRQSGANVVDASDAIRERVAEITRDLAPKFKGFELSILRDGAKPVREAVNDATEAILLGILLTVGVVLLFLGNFRSTIITGLALPNSILGAFLLMWLAHFSVNITTLAALALAVGLLIDDAIVVRENIFRRIEEGEPPRVAAVAGAREVTLAVVATTLTVLSVFGPVSLLKGIIGQFFKEFGMTICFAMLISLLDSLTIAPMLSAYFAGRRGKGKAEPPTKGLLGAFRRMEASQERLYMRVLDKTLRHPLWVLGGASAVFGLSFVVLAAIPKSFVPSQETGEFRVEIELPAGASLDATDAVIREAERRIHSHPEVLRTVASAGGDIGSKNAGDVVVELKPSGQRNVTTGAFKDLVRGELQNLPQAIVRVEDMLDIGGGAGQPFVVNITGQDLEQIKTVSSELVDKLKQDPDFKDVGRSYQAGAREIRWRVEPSRAEELGVLSGEVGNELRILVSGATPVRYHEGGREYDVRVRLNPEQAKHELEMETPGVVVPNLNHRMIPLSALAKREEGESPARIQRQNRKRYIEVNSGLSSTGRGLSAALAETRRLFDSGEIKLPSGVHYEFAGQTKDFQELLNSVVLAVGLSIGFIFLILASLYESFFIPLSIMLVLPLAVCGAFYALGITRSAMDIYSMIGCVLLMGVAAKNSILLVDYIQEALREGKNLRDAILNAGRVRLRPILMTSFALIAGMLPMALPLQEAAKSRAPMAIAVIGGIITSTLLTLVVVPAAFEYLLRFENWVLRRFRGAE